ncbi:hypothetical protein ACH5RR_029844 [Cinchona calisaya]|uniref:Uncharacterized protein n=1 Tax=Cinchona calisaya TaxID=153742 RepID=A0ABD2YU26_9GENT
MEGGKCNLAWRVMVCNTQQRMRLMVKFVEPSPSPSLIHGQYTSGQISNEAAFDSFPTETPDRPSYLDHSPSSRQLEASIRLSAILLRPKNQHRWAVSARRK